jgi:hypothetical protein
MIQRENQFTFGRARPPRKILGTVIGVMNELGAYGHSPVTVPIPNRRTKKGQSNNLAV